MAEEIIQRQTAALRRSYSPQPAMGLNGTTRQSLTQSQQLDRLLSGMGDVINSANNEIQRRETKGPGTLIGMGRSGPDQIARLRQLNRMAASDGSRGNGSGRQRRRGNGSGRGPGVGLGRQHRNSGRPRGS